MTYTRCTFIRLRFGKQQFGCGRLQINELTISDKLQVLREATLTTFFAQAVCVIILGMLISPSVTAYVASGVGNGSHFSILFHAQNVLLRASCTRTDQAHFWC